MILNRPVINETKKERLEAAAGCFVFFLQGWVTYWRLVLLELFATALCSVRSPVP